MGQDYLLAIDNGTQSIRALLFDLNGHIAARSKVEIEPYFSEQPGWAEQHPQYFWRSCAKPASSCGQTPKSPRQPWPGWR